jgi:hypothetical protein
MLQHHDADGNGVRTIKDEMAETRQLESSEPPLFQVKWEMQGVSFDRFNGGLKLGFETICYFRSRFAVVVGDDFIKILLNQGMEIQRPAHAG